MMLEKSDQKRSKQAHDDAKRRKFGARGEGEGEGCPLPFWGQGVNRTTEASKRPDPLFEGSAD